MNDEERESRISRRGFMERAAVVAVTVSVPGWVVACGGSSDDAEPEPTGGGGETTGGGEATGGDVAATDADRVAALEEGGVFTAAEPGQWTDKAPSHVPQVTFAEGIVELFTQHGMSPEHYITAQYVKDQDGALIGLATHEGTDAEARASFAIPAGTTQITAYSHCNIHGDWSADPASPSA